MSGFIVSPAKYRKVRGSVSLEADVERAEAVEAIVKVKEAGYVPSSVKVHARIDPHMVTGEISTKSLNALDNDPKVEAVSVGRRLKIIE